MIHDNQFLLSKVGLDGFIRACYFKAEPDGVGKEKQGSVGAF